MNKKTTISYLGRIKWGGPLKKDLPGIEIPGVAK